MTTKNQPKAFKTVTVGLIDDADKYHWVTFMLYGKDVSCFAYSNSGIGEWNRREEFAKMAREAKKLLK